MRSLIILIVSCAAFLSVACADNGPKIVQNSNSEPQRAEKRETVIAHTIENQTPPGISNVTNPGVKTKWTQSGDPIDTKEFDSAIATAQKALKAKPNDKPAKQILSVAYFKRAVALTDARQYASALGDYRRAMKYDPDNAEAKDWIEKIVSIYETMNREAPPEGQEPPPLPYRGKK